MSNIYYYAYIINLLYCILPYTYILHTCMHTAAKTAAVVRSTKSLLDDDWGQAMVSKVWFLCLMAYQLFLGYLMPKPFS